MPGWGDHRIRVAGVEIAFLVEDAAIQVSFEGEIPEDTLAALSMLLNERLAGLTLKEIRLTLPERLRDSRPDDSVSAEELLNIFIESGSDLFDWSDLEEREVLLGNASLLAAQPEFTSGESLKSLIELTERSNVLLAHRIAYVSTIPGSDFLAGVLVELVRPAWGGVGIIRPHTVLVEIIEARGAQQVRSEHGEEEQMGSCDHDVLARGLAKRAGDDRPLEGVGPRVT